MADIRAVEVLTASVCLVKCPSQYLKAVKVLTRYTPVRGFMRWASVLWWSVCFFGRTCWKSACSAIDGVTVRMDLICVLSSALFHFEREGGWICCARRWYPFQILAVVISGYVRCISGGA